MTFGERLPGEFYRRDALEVAPELLHKVLVVDDVAGRIVEVEAYRADDPASHSFRGPTARTRVMFGPGGRLYVYFTYGMHHCANVVTGDDGDGQAVLLRAAVPVTGIETMRARRAGRADRHLADGPGKLCQAFAIDRDDDGADLIAGDRIAVVDDGAPVPAAVTTARIGIRVGLDRPWRWLVA